MAWEGDVHLSCPSSICQWLSIAFTKLQVREWKGLLSFVVGSSLYWGREAWFEESASGIRSFPTLL